MRAIGSASSSEVMYAVALEGKASAGRSSRGIKLFEGSVCEPAFTKMDPPKEGSLTSCAPGIQKFPPVRRMIKSSLVVAALRRQERRASASRICVIGRRKKAGRHHASGPSSEGTLRGALVEEALEDLALFCLGAQAVQGSGTLPTWMEPSVPMVMRCTEPAGGGGGFRNTLRALARGCFRVW